MNAEARSRLMAGAMLIVLGLGLYALRYFNDIGESVVLALLGGLFVAAYFRLRSYGFLVPGGILLGLGAGSMLERQLSRYGDAREIGLGAGFLLIYLVALMYERRSHWWPLIPGGVLLLLGFHAWRDFRRFLFSEGWPLILVIVGVLILLGGIGRARRGSDAG